MPADLPALDHARDGNGTRPGTPAELRGRGLFTGAACRCVIHPAAPGDGLVFRRLDLDGRPAIPADVRFVVPEARHTVLGAPGNPHAVIHTTEHLLAALAGLRIHDAMIEVDGPEIPFADGSAEPFVRALRDAGVAGASPSAPAPIVIGELVRLADGAAWIEAAPADGSALELEYRLDYGPDTSIPRQSITVRLEDGAAGALAFERELAPARTFCTQREAIVLREAGLFAHLSARDVLVYDAGAPVENHERLPHEPARHKALDLLGDLALAGRPVHGRITAHRSGHALNHALTRALRSRFGAGLP